VTPELVIAWMGLIVAVAAALKAMQLLLNAALETARRARVLDDLTDEEGWPNGATTLKESHRDLYEKVSLIDLKVSEMQRAIEAIVERGK
jgi:hypothetical protein